MRVKFASLLTLLLLIPSTALLSHRGCVIPSSTSSFPLPPEALYEHSGGRKRSGRDRERFPTRLNAINRPVRVSSSDWVNCLTSLPTSRILARTKWNIVTVSLWSAFLTFLFKTCKLNWLQLPASLGTLMGPTLSLLLVFRTNSSYDRFWEARKAQSTMIQACRNIALHASSHIPRQHWQEIAVLLTTYALVQKQHLQGRVSNEELAPLYSAPDRIEEIQRKTNRPLYVIHLIETLIFHALATKYRDAALATAASKEPTVDAYAYMPKYIEKHFIEQIHALSSQLVACERILKQPVPLSYSRHTSRFLSFYLFLLPLTLVGSLGWLTVPITTIISWSLVSVQEIAHFIEEPFDASKQIIQMNSLVSVVRSDVSELLGDALCGIEMERLDATLLQETLDNSRDGDEVRSGLYTKH